MERNESLITTEEQTPRYPALVEAEKMFEKMAALTRETAARAYELFLERSTKFTGDLEDWLRAEMETVRAAPAKITEDKDAVHVMIGAPGFKLSDVEMSIDNNVLMVSGERSEEKQTEEANTIFNEWRSNRFLRQLPLPANVEAKDIKSEMKDGVLTIDLKKQAAAEPPKAAATAG